MSRLFIFTLVRLFPDRRKKLTHVKTLVCSFDLWTLRSIALTSMWFQDTSFWCGVRYSVLPLGMNILSNLRTWVLTLNYYTQVLESNIIIGSEINTTQVEMEVGFRDSERDSSYTTVDSRGWLNDSNFNWEVDRWRLLNHQPLSEPICQYG